jgi:UDP-glucose 4-epimerase
VVGCGFIGERLALAALRRGLHTVVLTRSEPAATKTVLADVELLLGDAADVELVARAIAHVDAVLYAAGGLMPAASERDPGRDAGITYPPLLGVLEALRRNPHASFTYLSSGGTVYGQPRYLPVDEQHPTEPISAYGMLKLGGEDLACRYADAYALQVRILRCSNVYGERQPPDRGQGAVAVFAERIAHGEPIVLFGDGEVIRDYVYVDDVAEAALALLDAPSEQRVVNVGSGRGDSLNALIALFEAAAARRAVVERRAGRSFDVSEIVLDIARLKSLVPFEPTPLASGVERVLRAHGEARAGPAALVPPAA